jgi:hypothetical protein
LERLTRGGEAHVRSLERIARGMEDTSKRKRSDQLLSLSQEDLLLLGPEERERFKRIRVERARNILLQVEKEYGIVPESEACAPSEQEHYDDIVYNTTRSIVLKPAIKPIPHLKLTATI